MQDPIQQLEERVDRAVDRLRRFAGERDGLQAEVRELREQLEQRPAAAAGESDGVLPGEDREAVVAGLRRALDELRAE